MNKQTNHPIHLFIFPHIDLVASSKVLLRYELGHFLVHFRLLKLVAHPPPHTIENFRVTLDKGALKSSVLGHRPFEAAYWRKG